MFAGKALINKICKIHHRTVQVFYDDFKSHAELLCLFITDIFVIQPLIMHLHS